MAQAGCRDLTLELGFLFLANRSLAPLLSLLSTWLFSAAFCAGGLLLTIFSVSEEQASFSAPD
jgi:hypothetical protein